MSGTSDCWSSIRGNKQHQSMDRSVVGRRALVACENMLPGSRRAPGEGSSGFPFRIAKIYKYRLYALATVASAKQNRTIPVALVARAYGFSISPPPAPSAPPARA